ncbi:MAG TPA: hypothetical protein VHO06_18910 [Polyangia bacterium]|nr:hypothetical protein [Polyangia bacterium]
MREIVGAVVVVAAIILFRHLEAQKREKHNLRFWENDDDAGWVRIRFDTMQGTGNGGAEFEIRRTGDGRWESRLSSKSWRARTAELSKQLFAPPSGMPYPGIRSFDEVEFNDLTGMDWSYWERRLKAISAVEDDSASDSKSSRLAQIYRDHPDIGYQEPPWKPVADKYAPSIETAYRRFVHQG